MDKQTDTKIISFQGAHGAFSDMACRAVYPNLKTLPCADFETAMLAVENGDADLAMIPVDNSLAGRVAAIHQLLPETKLHIISEYFLDVSHNLVATKGTNIEDIKYIRSHVHALPQCRELLKEIGAQGVVSGDTALAAKEVSQMNDKTVAAISSKLAAEIYGLNILRSDVQDTKNNKTRFLVFAPYAEVPDYEPASSEKIVTSLLFRVRNIPSALYKAMGGFATNGVNMTKIESYMDGSDFGATQFYCDIEGHIDDRSVQLAIEELEFFAKEIRILGVYPRNTL